MDGHVIWITGAGRGIGAGLARTLAARGAEVWLTARSPAELAAVAAGIRQAGGRAVEAPADVADADQVAAVGTRLRAERGRCDVLVCCAGIGLFAPLMAAAVADLDRMLAVNVRGTLLCCQQALALMQPAKRGAIIGIGSVLSLTGYRNQGGYTASKHALLGLMRVLAKEVQADGIRVSMVCPGAVETELVRAARPDLDASALMAVDDVAQAVVYLLTLSERVAVDLIQLRRRGAEPFA